MPMMVPPEVALDRWIKERCRRRESGFSEYLGVLDVEGVEPHSFRSSLQLIKETMNEALRLEGPNASGGVEHPPFHFDYVAVHSRIENAHAIRHAGYSFIAVTLPMVVLIFKISRQLSRTAGITRFLVQGPEALDQDVLHGLFFQTQMNFLVSHEYTHHVHHHCVEAGAFTQLRNELPIGRGHDGLDPQAQELDADGYAVMLVLAHLLRGERRTSALDAFGQGGLPILAGDEVLLLCFLLTAFAYFCSFWRPEASNVSLYDLTHPPPPIRIKYVIEVAKM